ncbi:hypothetical protein D5086_016642 [Populus alba]|uniref:Uncharacterized protein n=1 Tax=Populus alba TaxID=43335 RepID=A0ACC4BV74_POPAL
MYSALEALQTTAQKRFIALDIRMPESADCQTHPGERARRQAHWTDKSHQKRKKQSSSRLALACTYHGGMDECLPS